MDCSGIYGAIGFVSRVGEDIITNIDLAYSGSEIYGATSDRDTESEPCCFPREEVRRDLRDGRGYECDIDEFPPVSKCLIAIERHRRNPNPECCTFRKYKAAFLVGG